MNDRHIVSAFDQDLMRIGAGIAEMGGLVEEQLGAAVRAIRERDSELAEEVIARDKRIDEMDAELEASAIEIMALRQPMANDLRSVVAAMKISSTLERMGDLAKNVAKRALVLNQNPPIKVIGSIARLGKQVQALVSDVLDAYTTGNTENAVEVWNRDVEIDEMHNSIFRELTTYMMEDPRTIGLGSQLMFVTKNLERIGDHATFIAEMTYFVVEGEALTDDRPKSSDWQDLAGEAEG